MRKFILTLLFLIFLITGCKYDRGLILFNSQPITKENALNDAKTFQAGQRVYYLFIAPKRMDNKYIRVQVFKMTDKAPWGGNEVIRTKDFRLMKDERYYHSDYFTLRHVIIRLPRRTRSRSARESLSIRSFRHCSLP